MRNQHQSFCLFVQSIFALLVVPFKGAFLAAFSLALLLLGTATPGLTQDSDSTLVIEAKALYYGDQVFLRWAPTNIASWKWGNDHGYVLNRYTISANGTYLSLNQYDASHVVLLEQAKPLPEAQWEILADSNDLAGVAAGTIYGDSLDVLPPGGASMLNIYQKSNELTTRFGYSLFAADQSWEVALAMGLAWIDTTINPDHEYVYIVSPYQPVTGYPIDNGFLTIATDTVFPLPQPKGIDGTGGDSLAYIRWFSSDESYTSYSIERSDNNGISYQTINQSPIVSTITGEFPESGNQISYTDSLPANGITYVYRVKGHSPFGLTSPPSDTVQVKGRPDPLVTFMSLDSIVELQSGKLTISWKFPQADEDKITGFHIYRAVNKEGPFVKINSTLLSPATRTYVDLTPNPSNYYQIGATDINGYKLTSFPLLGQLRDSIPPSIPIGLTGAANASGIVTLNWPRNPENDLLGYRVYMATSHPGDYTQVTSTWMNDTTFRYQLNLNTLSESVYFRITALDHHQNQSEQSAPVEIQRPDIVPPSAPVIRTVNASTSGVYFDWVLSSSLDVVGYEFQRKTDGKSGWAVLLSFDKQHLQTQFTDSTADKRYWYQYRLVAIDEAGNRAGSRFVKAKPINDGLRVAVQNLSAQYVPGSSSSNAFATVTWAYGKDADLIGFQLYRGLDSLKMYAYRFFPDPLPQQQSAVMDMSVSPNGAGLQYLFYDFDLAFTEHLQTNYTYVYNTAANPNLAMPAPPTSPPPAGSTITYTVANKNYPTNGSPGKVWYWVMAKYADGSTSPLAGPVWINL
jgi:hypothetical protein